MQQWVDKMHDELDQLVDDMVKERFFMVIESLEDAVADSISFFDSNIMDTADQYADGITQKDIQKAIMEFQCSAELRLKSRIEDYVKGY